MLLRIMAQKVVHHISSLVIERNIRNKNKILVDIMKQKEASMRFWAEALCNVNYTRISYPTLVHYIRAFRTFYERINSILGYLLLFGSKEWEK